MTTSLSHLTTLRVGGTPRSLTVVTNETEIIEAVRSADADGRPVLILGGGSNILVADEFAGDVIKIESRGIENDASACAGAWVTVQAGHSWDDFVAHAVAHEWVGIEALSGIPGTVGATPIQNVGAYGQQVSDTIAQVRAWNRDTNQVDTLFVSGCEFGYRSSLFKSNPGKWVVLSVTFQLKLGDRSLPITYPELAAQVGTEVGLRAPLLDVRDAVLALRRGKGMVVDPSDPDTWSVGSFFLNPRSDLVPEGAPSWEQPDGLHKISAAWLIEQSGFGKGFGLNNRATVSTKHTLALTNRGDATASDVMELATHIRAGVQNKFGIVLDIEPQIISA